MKNITIAVMAVLLALAGYVIAKDKAPESAMTRGDGYVKPLPREAEKALGVKNLAFVMAVNGHGKVEMFRPENTEHTQVKLPLDKSVVIRHI